MTQRIETEWTGRHQGKDKLPMQPHDSPLDWIITPDEVIETHTPYPQPTGLDWDAVRPEQFETIPALRILRAHLDSTG